MIYLLAMEEWSMVKWSKGKLMVWPEAACNI